MFRECKSDTRPICREKLSALVYGQKTCTPRYRHKQEISMGIAQWCRCQLHFLSPLPNADDSRAMPKVGLCAGALCPLFHGKALSHSNLFPVPGQSTIPGQHVPGQSTRAVCSRFKGKALYRGNMFPVPGQSTIQGQSAIQGQHVHCPRANHYPKKICSWNQSPYKRS